MALAIDLLGWLGAGMLLAAYGLASVGRWSAEGLAFQVMNVVGAVLLGLNTAYHGAWPSTLLNLFWMIVGIVALARLAARRPLSRGR